MAWILILMTGIQGYALSGRAQYAMRKSGCTLATAYNDYLYGVKYHSINYGKETTWDGLMNIDDTLTALKDELVNNIGSVAGYVNTRFASTTWMDTATGEYPALLTKLENIYTSFHTRTVANPDPYTLADTPTINPS